MRYSVCIFVARDEFLKLATFDSLKQADDKMKELGENFKNDEIDYRLEKDLPTLCSIEVETNSFLKIIFLNKVFHLFILKEEPDPAPRGAESIRFSEYVFSKFRNRFITYIKWEA